MINRIAAAACLILSCLAQPAFAANLIRNGSFEKPVAPAGSYLQFSTGEKFSGWTVVGAPRSASQVWKRLSLTFTAAKSKTKIAFINGDPSSDTHNGLDGISLVTVP
jgi:hypothetical protein